MTRMKVQGITMQDLVAVLGLGFVLGFVIAVALVT